MSDIRPIDLPTAAGVEFGRGDVRHFSESDAVDVVGLQNPTRHLAERDNLLAEKVNELVGEVNNKEQFVPLSVPRTAIAPGTEEVVTNFAIPDGFEARIINATVGSTPVSSDISLKIYYANGYGSVTGTELVSTTGTFTAGVAFYNQGEFIVALRNNGASSLEVVASITLTVRPIGSTASLLVGSVIKGDKGLPGGRGDRGLKGDPGTGGAGSPGMVWSGAFDASHSYTPPQAVSYTNGGVTQSYICKLNNPGPGAQPPTNGTYWDLIVSAGSGGAGVNWTGPWSSAASYSPLDAVSDAVGGVTSSYICVVAVGPVGTHPGSDATHWGIMAGPGNGETPVYDFQDVSSLLSYTASIGQTVLRGSYRPYGVSSGVSPLPAMAFKEYSIQNTLGTVKGLVFLNGQWFVYLKAGDTLTLTLNVSPFTSFQWNTYEVICQVSANGTASVSGSVASLVEVVVGGADYAITNLASVDVETQISLTGVKPN